MVWLKVFTDLPETLLTWCDAKLLLDYYLKLADLATDLDFEEFPIVTKLDVYLLSGAIATIISCQKQCNFVVTSELCQGTVLIKLYSLMVELLLASKDSFLQVYLIH